MDPKYSPEQRAEACRLVNHLGFSPGDAALRLASGSADLEPFTMPPDTVRKYAQRARVNSAVPLRKQDQHTDKLWNELYRGVSIMVSQLMQRIDDGEQVSAQEMKTTIANVQAFKAQSQEPAKAKDKTESLSALTSKLQKRAKATS